MTQNYHSIIEKSLFILVVLIVVVASIGGMVQILPLFKKEIAIEVVDAGRPYTPLELLGFGIYKREGCYGCHSQQVRTLRDEVERYGHYSIAAESHYDFPFVWGSKRTGPDLARIGEKYSDDWHIEHLHDPRSVVPESIMPGYPFMLKALLNLEDLRRKMEILQSLGVPYTDSDIEHCYEDIKIQLSLSENQAATEDFNKRYPGAKIRKFNNKSAEITEMDAIVGYLQSLGTRLDLKTNKGRKW
ncbi:MAG: cytochrome-c oxidase, cbb3-type subunit II [Candidatus Midichloria sp.]|nr:cytochrome-c oxidase, cbb3-type subunit II [Candidatus Midichloria sp.]